MKLKLASFEKGDTLIYLLVMVFIFSAVMLPIMSTLITKSRLSVATIDREEALQIAEAGANYYQWHLSEFSTDYKDGTNHAGPYVHQYVDADTQKTIGQFSLVITPPTPGSTVVTIQSTGSTSDNPHITRTVTARYGIPSLALYSFLSNDVIWIGPGETVSGQMQSNNGVRFDGTTNAPVESAKSTYTCATNQGTPCPATENGVWGNAPQATQNFWKFPVPAVDFSALTVNLANMKSMAQASGLYLPPSNAQGYSIVFNANGTVSVYKVTTLLTNPTGYDVYGGAHNEYVDYNARTLQYTVPVPQNSTIYAEDNVWVEGTVSGRVMVAAALLPYNPSSAPKIYIPNNIIYTARDGSDVLGLLSQSNIVVTYHAPANIEIDAALIAQNGSAEFYYYKTAPPIDNTITVFGSIMTFGEWTWTWIDGSGNNISGYTNTDDIYDPNLLYAPPPLFPISSSGYQPLSWVSN